MEYMIKLFNILYSNFLFLKKLFELDSLIYRTKSVCFIRYEIRLSSHLIRIKIFKKLVVGVHI